MKSLIKIYSRYILTASLLILLLLTANILLLFGVSFYYTTMVPETSLFYSKINTIAANITCEPSVNHGEPFLSEDGIRLARKNRYCFAFILSPQGDRIWDWETPEEFPEHFSAGDITAFSKWYLRDYPVKTWRYGDYLLVCGQPQNSVWKYHMEFPETFMNNIDSYLKYAFFINLVILLLVLLIAGYRFAVSLRPLAQGIASLADGNAVSLSEKGVTGELCSRLNRTSHILKEQRDALTKRDNARTEWISGVSHDIRTPLSMIMGYADSLSDDDSLSGEQRRQADIIKQQSIVIKKLIEDLNLTSKLEYDMQPLRISKFRLAPFLRSSVASYLNEGLENIYEIELNIPDYFENVSIEGDKDMLHRAVNNLIGNSIRHNPAGCCINISAALLSSAVCSVCIRDNGVGIPAQVIRTLEETSSATGRVPHIMGLRIARQIVLSHKGKFYFSADRHGIIMNFSVCE